MALGVTVCGPCGLYFRISIHAFPHSGCSRYGNCISHEIGNQDIAIPLEIGQLILVERHLCPEVKGCFRGNVVSNPETVATAIRIGNPASWDLAVAARDESNGSIDTVSDDEILESYKLMASKEGIFCEPASAASVAGLRKAVASGLNLKESRVVCVITGTGLKEPELAAKQTMSIPKEISPTIIAVRDALGL